MTEEEKAAEDEKACYEHVLEPSLTNGLHCSTGPAQGQAAS